MSDEIAEALKEFGKETGDISELRLGSSDNSTEIEIKCDCNHTFRRRIKDKFRGPYECPNCGWAFTFKIRKAK